jgi:pimeloyl-ACP methyl ester carboxylesterase
VYYGYGVPHGNGTGVLLVPAFLSTDLYLVELYGWLQRIGYRPYFSGIGLNADCPDLLIRNRIGNSIDRALRETGSRIHLIGHSLGGVIARSVAAQRPHDIASVTTLGAPSHLDAVTKSRILRSAEIVRTYIVGEHGKEVLDDCYTGRCACDFVQFLKTDLPVSIQQTSIYSRDDLCVDWRSCATGNSDSDFAVAGTHAGLAFNASAYRVVAARLAGVQRQAASKAHRRTARKKRRDRSGRFRA